MCSDIPASAMITDYSTLEIDDETGKILCINYEVYASWHVNGMWERNQALMDAFSEIYFSQLGLTETAEYAMSVESGYDYWEIDGGLSIAKYNFGDVISGGINMELYAGVPGMFWVAFP